MLLYKSLLAQGHKEPLKQLTVLLPASKVHTTKLIDSLSSSNIQGIRTAVTQLFLNGYLLDDILLSLEKSIAIFPSIDPAIRFRILKFTMLGWIYIQQGKEHWLDTMDIVEQVMRDI
jgi:hypothetical protein